jgi:hypothetical protein
LTAAHKAGDSQLHDRNEPLQGGCACGAVRFTAHGAPKRVGLCHCLDCRKAHAAAFNPFVVFACSDVHWIGELKSWQSSPDYDRRFCPNCGSRVLAITGDEIELSIGSLDVPGALFPEYESWVIRREPWLPALPIPQHDRSR